MPVPEQYIFGRAGGERSASLELFWPESHEQAFGQIGWTIHSPAGDDHVLERGERLI